jgi:hypothetical protein
MSVSWLRIVASCFVSMPMDVCQLTSRAETNSPWEPERPARPPSQQSLGKRRAGPTLIWVVPLRELVAKRPPAVKSRGAVSVPLEFNHWGIGA